jgi:septal ring factor EnvC (AmiA/AmiB activator)
VDALSAIVNAAVVAAVGLLLARYTKGRFDENERQHARIEARLGAHDVRFDALDRRMSGFEARMESFESRMVSFDQRLDSFERSVDSMRSDLTRVALAVGAGPSAKAGG